MTALSAIKVLAVLGVLVGLYFIIEEMMDMSLSIDSSEGDDESKSGYLQKVAGISLEDQLIEVLLMISSCLKAGRNLDQAFELVAVSTPPPICNEFRKLVQERRLGVPMVEALTNLSSRVPSQDLRLAVNATIFQQETGGNLEDLYRQIVMTVAERKKIMGKIIAGTAHAKISGNMVGSIPLVLASIITLFHPQYLLPMLENHIGQLITIISILSALVGLTIVNRMTESILPDSEDAVISSNEAQKTKSTAVKILAPLTKPLAALNRVIPGKWFDKKKKEVKFLLEASNKTASYTPEDFLALMEVSMIISCILAFVLVNPFVFGVWSWFAIIIIAMICFRLPRIYLVQIIRRRQKNIEYELPYIIDLLSLAVESGFDLTGAIAKIVEKQRDTDIIVEFKMFLADIKVGKSLEEALSEMSERVRVLSFFSFVSSLIQAQRLGAEIGPTLRAQAEQMRYQRMIMAEAKVNKLPVKLLVPLIFFIFPSIAVLLIGPAILEVYQSFPKIHSSSPQKASASSQDIEPKQTTTTSSESSSIRIKNQEDTYTEIINIREGEVKSQDQLDSID